MEVFKMFLFFIILYILISPTILLVGFLFNFIFKSSEYLYKIFGNDNKKEFSHSEKINAESNIEKSSLELITTKTIRKSNQSYEYVQEDKVFTDTNKNLIDYNRLSIMDYYSHLDYSEKVENEELYDYVFEKYTEIIDLNNDEFQKALELIRDTNETFFLTGKAGTGKSTFLKHIIHNINKNFIVLAPTGIAAVNVNGVTINSFFQFPLRPLIPNDDEITLFNENSEKRNIIKALDTLIIDEISMVRADVIDAIDYSLRKNGGNPDLPFGGKQIVFVGDIFQLEPVLVEAEKKLYNQFYNSVFFYNAIVFKNIELLTIELKKVYRQVEIEFIKLLDKVRTNEITQLELDILNTRVFTNSELNAKEFVISLTTTNNLADNVNRNRLQSLNNDEFKFNAEISNNFENSKFPAELELSLKIGAQVIFIKNDIEKRWVNGTIGVVYDLSENEIQIQLKDGSIHLVEKRVWENVKFQYNGISSKVEKEVIGTFTQYPLKLAWAITIHKSQGLTFDNVVIDFGNGTFSSGQAYVALSRVKSFDGLHLQRNLYLSDIKINESILHFATSFNDNEKIIERINFGKKITDLKKYNNLEGIGRLYFENAITNLINNNYKSSYKDFINGFEYISCDCILVTLLKKYLPDINKSYNKKIFNCSIPELNLILAIIYYYYTSKAPKGTPINALSYIDSFLLFHPDLEIGHYIKGRILADYNFSEALTEYEIALNLNNNQRINYRIGRLKEFELNEFGINYLYQSVLLNPSSICAMNRFKLVCDKRNIKLLTNNDKFLANLFNNSNSDEFIATIIKLKKDGYLTLDNSETLSVTQAYSDFKYGLKEDENLFMNYSYEEFDEDDDSYNYNDDRPRYSKYGGANGLDDRTIDDAFDGDADNYWNVD